MSTVLRVRNMSALLKTRKVIGTLRRRLNDEHKQRMLHRALRTYAHAPSQFAAYNNRVIDRLVRGWNNESWSAMGEYLVACLNYTISSDGPILECGTGLTTIAVGLMAKTLGKSVWSLEHNPEWAEKVAGYLKTYRVDSVHLNVCGIKGFSGFSWYDAPLEVMPQFSLVICDGPPASMDGGRYGLLPVMKSKLKPGAVILLDDALRQEERTIASRWASELNTSYTFVGADRPYIVLTLPQG